MPSTFDTVHSRTWNRLTAILNCPAVAPSDVCQSTMLQIIVSELLVLLFRYYKFQNDTNAGPMYIDEQSGPYAQYGPVRLGFMARSGSTSPDVELLVMTSGVEGSGDRDCNTCFRILVMNLKPKARQPFMIKTSDMQEWCDCGGKTCVSGDVCQPRLYLTNKDDVQLLQWAYERIVKAAKDEGYTVLTPKQSDPEGIAEFLKNNREAKFSASHWAGTCRLGKCTDLDLKIRGTTNIFVADSSIFPSPVRAHNVATVYAVAHKASSVIRDANVGHSHSRKLQFQIV